MHQTIDEGAEPAPAPGSPPVEQETGNVPRRAYTSEDKNASVQVSSPTPSAPTLLSMHCRGDPSAWSSGRPLILSILSTCFQLSGVHGTAVVNAHMVTDALLRRSLRRAKCHFVSSEEEDPCAARAREERASVKGGRGPLARVAGDTLARVSPARDREPLGRDSVGLSQDDAVRQESTGAYTCAHIRMYPHGLRVVHAVRCPSEEQARDAHVFHGRSSAHVVSEWS
jgi:hypothetical protein